ncbi:nucleotidyltransferase domain-containing protein [Cytophagaceae bacterium DM2B3-1]|uniref:Nucleotidyltransferase domain-containing protein n=1 Tax=Xanthocytophaga flava TaxID=3048013 RepID=A0ABT7CY73_9BACT|nr:nucleotidyltransferase domain-containing protein [Xanthocytophaga flavus]MDJ1498719.1 nucleotidyltransferase domain-containing protein [Xanthocytophaga flavus]
MMILPKEKQEILDTIVKDLKGITNVQAIVLGGSYATGTATETSDLDIGIYYYEKAPFDIREIQAIAKKYAKDSSPTVTGFYEWGPWVNGGAWVKTAYGKVDLLYKNIEQITTTIDNAQEGLWENHFEQQPPYGFSSIIFLAETQVCIPLYDPEGIIAKLKSAVQTYPPKLKQLVVQQSLWSAEFTIWHADSFAVKQDVYNTLGCLTRAIKNIVTALFALNELYPISDKRAIQVLEQSTIKPPHLTDKINAVLCVDMDTLSENVTLLKSLFNEVVDLAQEMYKPAYQL